MNSLSNSQQNVNSDFAKASGGRKAMLLRQHRQMVLSHLQLFGREKTLEYFNLEPQTLDRLINSEKKDNLAYGVAEKADAKTELLREDVRQMRVAVRQVEEELRQFETHVIEGLAKRIVEPLIGKTLELPENSKVKSDPLSLVDFNGDISGKKALPQAKQSQSICYVSRSKRSASQSGNSMKRKVSSDPPAKRGFDDS